jgi:hypothetical protein
VAAAAFCRPGAKELHVDFDVLKVARIMPGTKPVPAEALEALRIAAFRWIVPNDPPPPNASVVYVSVITADGMEVDPSQAVMAAGMRPGDAVLPASKEPSAAEQRLKNVGAFRYVVGFPVERLNGRYEIVYGYDCAIVCLATISLFLRNDTQAWQVYDSRMNAIR